MKIKNLIKSDLVKNISSLSLIQIANYIVPLILIPYISRVVGVENYGKLEYARSLVLYFTIFIDYGFNYTATRDISINRNNQKELNTIFSQVIISKGILFTIATIIFYGLIQLDESLLDLKNILFATYFINIGFVLFPIWFYQGIEKIASIATINFCIKIAVLGLTFIFLKQRSDYWIYNFLQSLAQVLAGVFSITYAFKKYKIRIVKISLRQIILRFKEGFAVFFSSLLVSLIAHFSFIVLQDYDSKGIEGTLGIYSTAFKLVITLQYIIIVPFSQAFFPYMNKLIINDIKSYRNKIKQASRLLIGLNLGIILFCYIFAEFIIQIIFGEEYLLAVTPFRSFLLLPLFACLTNLYSYQGLLTLKKDRIFMVIHIVFAVLTILTNIYFIPVYGLYAAISLRIIIEMSIFLTSFVLYKKYVRLKAT